MRKLIYLALAVSMLASCASSKPYFKVLGVNDNTAKPQNGYAYQVLVYDSETKTTHNIYTDARLTENHTYPQEFFIHKSQK
jgi:hypothetical protein